VSAKEGEEIAIEINGDSNRFLCKNNDRKWLTWDQVLVVKKDGLLNDVATLRIEINCCDIAKVFIRRYLQGNKSRGVTGDGNLSDEEEYYITDSNFKIKAVRAPVCHGINPDKWEQDHKDKC